MTEKQATEYFKNLPREERTRLMPIHIVDKLTSIRQEQQRAERRHKAHMHHLNQMIRTYLAELEKYTL